MLCPTDIFNETIFCPCFSSFSPLTLSNYLECEVYEVPVSSVDSFHVLSELVLSCDISTQ